MNKNIELLEGKYYYVFDYNNDYSFFTKEEWNTIKKMYDLMDQHSGYLGCDSDYSWKKTPKEYKDAAYWFNYNLGINRLYTFETSVMTTHELFLKFVEMKTINYIKINKIREKICEKYDDLLEKYNYLNKT
jgi:hypothetical protein